MSINTPLTPSDTVAADGPIRATRRITNLDAIRGLAVLGILVMNAVSYGLPEAAYFNLSAGGSDSWLDWTVGVLGEVFVDQKMMALFSLLFGVGMVLFAERAQAKGHRAKWLSEWRNFLLLGIGLLHTAIWEGDVLVVYALCSPVVLALRHRRPRALLIAGSVMVLSSAVWAIVAQTTLPSGGFGLGSYWFTEGGYMSDSVGIYLIADFFLRSLGMMLIGVALYRTGIVHGSKPQEFYRRMVRMGMGVGIPIAIAGVSLQAFTGFSTDVALVGEVPNTLATIPMAFGYLGLITLWNQRPSTSLHSRIRSLGRMALTNYLAQSLVGFFVLRVVLDRGDLSRSAIAGFTLSVWALQLVWSKWWLDRLRFGPAEWAWRSLTYRKLQPLRRPRKTRSTADL